MTDRRLARRRITPVLLSALLVVCLGYQAYRYPFQINSALTSPTYSSTPAWLQFGKWALIAAIAAVLALVTLPTMRATLRRTPPIRVVALGLQVLLLVSALLRITTGAASVEPWILLVLAAIGLLITLVPAVDGRTGALVVRILVGYSVVCIVVELVQVLLFVLLDRLPALAYADSPSVRFGSVLDDPNGFAVLLALLLPASLIALQSRPNARLVVSVALLACLPLSQSWTGVTAAMIAISVTYLTARGIQRDAKRVASLLVSGFVIVGVAAFFARSTIAELIRLKRGSAEEHVASFAHIAPTPTEPAEPSTSASGAGSLSPSAPPSHRTLPGSIDVGQGGSAQPVAATWTHGIESGYVNLLVNYGPVLLVAYIVLGVLSAVVLLRGRTGLPLALRVGGASYLICFLLASANLGLDRTFPCNVLYFFLCGLALATAAPRRGRTLARPRLRGRRADPLHDPAADPLLVPRGDDALIREQPRDAASRGDTSTDRPLVLRRNARGERRRRSTQRRTVQAAPVRIEGTR